MDKRFFLKGIISACVIGSTSRVRAEEYLTVAKAQDLLFPGEKLSPASVTLTKDQQKLIESTSKVRVRGETVNAWKSSSGDWFIVDNVVGKHEFIDFALALSAKGSVKGVEILTYRETYGGQVRDAKWLDQFKGKNSSSAIQIDSDIKNISGATLSSVHMTEGVRRLVKTWEIALKGK